VTLSHLAQGAGTQKVVCAQGTAKSTHLTEFKRSILPTAMVYVKNAKGDHVTCRLLLHPSSRTDTVGITHFGYGNLFLEYVVKDLYQGYTFEKQIKML